MKRLFLALAALLWIAPPLRAGGIEPFLARLSAGEIGKATVPASAPLAWDPDEAAAGRARVWLQRQPGVSWEMLRAEVAHLSPTTVWEGDAGEFAQITGPWSDLSRIAALPSVFYLLRPPRGIPTVESEGLDSMRVSAFRALNRGGTGARVAVLDLGFKGYENLLGIELPRDLRTRSFFRSPSGEGDIHGEGADADHGTACAEVVMDVAPDARLYLVNVESPLDLQSAVDWLVSERVSVISHSVGWYFGGMDGTGPIDDIAADAARRGVLWVNAAGNEANRHTWAPARDADGDGLLEFDEAGDELLDFRSLGAGGQLDLVLLWDSWPTSTGLEMNLEVVDEGGTLLATSESDFAGYPYAFRYLGYTAVDSRPVAARVRLDRGSIAGHTIHVFRLGQGIQVQMEDHRKPDRSLLCPADSPEVVAVGAVDWQTEQLDSYSSRGAYEGEPVKPEICGPVGVSTRTYERFGFRGTSAAAPHVAGAAALLASYRLHGGAYDLIWSPDEIKAILRSAAKPAPQIVPLAWGIVRMPVPKSRSAAGPILLGNPAATDARWVAPCAEVEIIDAGGRVVARSSAGGWRGRGTDGRELPAGVYWIRCPGRAASRLVWLGR